jgi:hypothetical protein
MANTAFADTAFSGVTVVTGAHAVACRKTGRFIDKGGCYALHDEEGVYLWLDIDPVPLHMIDQTVEISGRQFGARHIWVEAIGPIGALPKGHG